MKKLFNLIVDLFVAGTESKRKIGAPALFLLLPFRTSAVSICTWFLKCQFGSLLQTRKKNQFHIKLDFFFEFELDFYCLCSLQKSISKSNWFLNFLNLIFRNWKKIKWHSIFQKSSGDRQGAWHGGVYIPYGKSRLQGFEKIYVGRLFSGYLKLGVLGAWMTFKKAEMAKTLRNGLSMIETNPLNHNWLDFVILSGLTLHQFQKKLQLSHALYRNRR